MEYTNEGISASIQRHQNKIIVKNLEIDSGLIMNFGEDQYLPAFHDFIECIEKNEFSEIRFEVERSGYKMLLARFGYELEAGDMIKRGVNTEITRKNSLAASTFDSMSGSAFHPASLIKLSDGSLKPVSDLEVGDDVAFGGLVTAIMRGRQRNFTDIRGIRCGSSSGMYHSGQWIRAKDHPDAVSLDFPEGLDGYVIGTMDHKLEIQGELFSDFYETVTRHSELSVFSDQALEIMNSKEKDAGNKGWTTRIWHRKEIEIVKSWWSKMCKAGYGDWGDGPAIDEISPIGFMAELNGDPTACVFLYSPPGEKYAAVYSAICDVEKSNHACLRGMSLAASAAIKYCEVAGVEEIVCYVETPAVVKSFQIAGYHDDGQRYNHVYLSDEVVLWLEP